MNNLAIFKILRILLLCSLGSIISASVSTTLQQYCQNGHNGNADKIPDVKLQLYFIFENYLTPQDYETVNALPNFNTFYWSIAAEFSKVFPQSTMQASALTGSNQACFLAKDPHHAGINNLKIYNCLPEHGDQTNVYKQIIANDKSVTVKMLPDGTPVINIFVYTLPSKKRFFKLKHKSTRLFSTKGELLIQFMKPEEPSLANYQIIRIENPEAFYEYDPDCVISQQQLSGFVNYIRGEYMRTIHYEICKNDQSVRNTLKIKHDYEVYKKITGKKLTVYEFEKDIETYMKEIGILTRKLPETTTSPVTTPLPKQTTTMKSVAKTETTAKSQQSVSATEKSTPKATGSTTKHGIKAKVPERTEIAAPGHTIKTTKKYPKVIISESCDADDEILCCYQLRNSFISNDAELNSLLRMSKEI